MTLRRTESVAIVLSIAALASVLFIAQYSAGRVKDKSKNSSAASKSEAKAEKSVADVELVREIDRILSEPDAQQGRWGVFVMSLKDGRVLYSHESDKPFTPASNMKVYTTAVALELLGTDYRWRTSVYVEKPPNANGVIDGDLTLYGRGAPDLTSRAKGEASSLTKLVDQLYQAGVRQIRGNVVGDASYLHGELFGTGWQWNDLQWYYGAEPSALSIDENSVEVTISPSEKDGESAGVVVKPNQNFIHITNHTQTAERGVTTNIGIIRDLSSNEVRVWGAFPAGGRGFSAFLSVHNPALWAATVFRQALIARGIKVDGEPRSRDFRETTSSQFDPQKAVELAHLESAPLGEIVRRTNKESNNLFAELILRTLGRERGTLPADVEARKNGIRGDDAIGTGLISSWLSAKGIATRNVSIRDGSGLSRLNLVTPEATARLLAAMTASNSALAFHESLPIAGRDGTLGSRLKTVSGRIFAKTGALTYTHSLSGYATTPSNETLAFSILSNDVIVERSAFHIIDQIATTIADLGGHRMSNP